MKLLEPLMAPADGDGTPAGAVGAASTPPSTPASAPATPPASGVAVGTEPGTAPDKLPPPGLSDEAMAGLMDDTPDVPDAPAAAPQPKPGSTPPVPAGQTPATPPVTPPVTTTPPTPPQVPPVATPQTPPAVPPTPAVTAVAPETPPATPPQPVVPQQSPQEIQAQQAARRQEYVTQVEKGYSFDEATALEVNANPAAILPKLAAKMHVDMLESAIHGIMMQVPQVLENLLVQRETTRRNEDEFYAAWPMIDRTKPEHRATVNGILSAIVQRNPSISRQEAMKQAGAATLVTLGIPYTAPAQATPPVSAGQPQVPSAPAAPVVPPVVGFTPALPGVGGQGIPGRQGEENPFSKMAREFDEEI